MVAPVQLVSDPDKLAALMTCRNLLDPQDKVLGAAIRRHDRRQVCKHRYPRAVDRNGAC